jgi:hypothetical protein
MLTSLPDVSVMNIAVASSGWGARQDRIKGQFRTPIPPLRRSTIRAPAGDLRSLPDVLTPLPKHPTWWMRPEAVVPAATLDCLI